MNGVVLALGILLLGGLMAFASGRSFALSRLIGVGSAVIGSIIGLGFSMYAIITRTSTLLCIPWQIPGGSLSLKLDPLSAFFLIPIFGLTALTAIYGKGYLSADTDKPVSGRHWFLFNLLSASMAIVCLAANVLLFLMAWEMMALSSFFLVAYDHHREEVRKASWSYMVATHLGVAMLIPMFLILSATCNSMEFQYFDGALSRPVAGLCFILAFVGFGAKAGIIPFHVWLPEAHPAAPTHISALMSGAMIKTGIYGLVRTWTFLGAPSIWWGWLLIGAGCITGIVGIIMALAQTDIKRLLAYSSVENIGIIILGLGAGLLGTATGHPLIGILGLGGAMLHVLNHAVFKGLLFLGAGSVYHSTHTRDMNQLGGLVKKMPLTGYTFMIGALAIAGLPPFNGFISEFMIYLTSFKGLISGNGAIALPLGLIIGALALIGGLAIACFTGAFGITFLGESRSEAAIQSHESSRFMTIPMIILACLCILFGLAGPFAAIPAMNAAGILCPHASFTDVNTMTSPIAYVVAGASLFIVLLTGLAMFRYVVQRRRQIEQAVTWDCGYIAPTPRMQYTASSFTLPIVALFRKILHIHRQIIMPATFFPQSVGIESITSDIGLEKLYRPLFRGVERLLSHLRPLQHGRIQIYILYPALTLIILLLWRLR